MPKNDAIISAFVFTFIIAAAGAIVYGIVHDLRASNERTEHIRIHVGNHATIRGTDQKVLILRCTDNNINIFVCRFPDHRISEFRTDELIPDAPLEKP